MFLANIKLGLVEFNATFIFQIINTVFLIPILAGIAFFIRFIIKNYYNHKKLKAMESKLIEIEKSIESGQNNE